MNTPTLETKRLILRKFDKTDIDALYQIYSDEEVNIFLPWFPLKSMDEARMFYDKNYLASGYCYRSSECSHSTGARRWTSLYYCDS